MKNDIKKKIENSFLFGCIKYQDNYTFYLMPIAYWILNYSKYDPTYRSSDWGATFRDDVLNVEEENTESFLKAIKIDKLEADIVRSAKNELANVFLFFIDFDSKTFVNYFNDVSAEDYLPNEEWIGRFDDPMECLPIGILLMFM